MTNIILRVWGGVSIPECQEGFLLCCDDLPGEHFHWVERKQHIFCGKDVQEVVIELSEEPFGR